MSMHARLKGYPCEVNNPANKVIDEENEFQRP